MNKIDNSMMDVKEGDIVQRYVGEGLPFMKMKVVKVTDELLYCNAATEHGKDPSPIADEQLEELWTFDRLTGAEEDPELGWGRTFGITGTYIRKIVPPTVN